MMRHPAILIACAGSALAVASPSFAQAAEDYVRKAGAGDLYEKQSSQLVLKTTKNPDLRNFAQMMVSDHSKSTADVKAAAMKSGLKPKPPMLDADKKEMIARLTASTGQQRDAMYVTQQRTAHAEALALHQGYAQSGGKALLKAAAAKIVPVVQHHAEMLDKMKM